MFELWRSLSFLSKRWLQFLIRPQGDTRVVKSVVWILPVKDQAFSSDTLISSGEMTTQFKMTKHVCEGGWDMGRDSLSSFYS